MRNVWLKYTVIRLCLFVVLCVVFGLLGLPWFFSVLFAGMLSFAYSMFFLGHLRDEISKQIYEKRSNTLGSGDTESDLENEIVDLEAKSKKSPAKPEGE
jgi:hypothetical protein